MPIPLSFFAEIKLVLFVPPHPLTPQLSFRPTNVPVALSECSSVRWNQPPWSPPTFFSCVETVASHRPRRSKVLTYHKVASSVVASDRFLRCLSSVRVVIIFCVRERIHRLMNRERNHIEGRGRRAFAPAGWSMLSIFPSQARQRYFDRALLWAGVLLRVSDKNDKTLCAIFRERLYGWLLTS